MLNKGAATYPVAQVIPGYYVATFRQAGIRTTDRLLNVAAQFRGRKAVATLLNIPKSEILEVVNKADLMRIKGVGEKHADLLILVGAGTVRELRYRNPERLCNALAEMNRSHRIVADAPALSWVARWIKQAKTLELKVTYR